MTPLDLQLGGREFHALSDGLTGGLRKIIPNGNTAALDSAAVTRFLLMMEREGFASQVTNGFVDGFAAGFVEGGKQWLRELLAYLRILGTGYAIGLEELLEHPLAGEEQAKGLAPATQSALAQLRSLQLMRQVIRWLGGLSPADALDALRETIPTAEEVGLFIGRVIADWLADLIRLAPDAVAAGHHIGRLLGRIVLELIRGVTEPPSVSMGLAVAGIVSDVEEWK